MAKSQERRYRDRLERLRYRAVFLRRLIETKPVPERGWSRELGEISALEWAVGVLTPWFDKRDEEPAPLAAVDPVDGIVAPVATRET